MKIINLTHVMVIPSDYFREENELIRRAINVKNIVYDVYHGDGFSELNPFLRQSWIREA